MIATKNFELKSQVSEVQFDSVTAIPQISITTENGLKESRAGDMPDIETHVSLFCRAINDMMCVVADYEEIEVQT